MDKRFKSTIHVFAGITFIALLAQLTLHLPDNLGGIPITGQSLAVLLVGFLLRPPLGVLAVGAYVILGALGLPLFADGRSGMEVLTGGSGGFLLGFVAAALLLGRFGAMGWMKRFDKSLLAMALGTLAILAFGVARLSILYGGAKALQYGFYPFWEGAIIKILLGAFLSVGYYRLTKAN